MVFQSLGMFFVPTLIFLDLSKRKRQFLGLTSPAALHTIVAVLVMIVALPIIDIIVVWNEGLQVPDRLGGEWMRELEEDARSSGNAILGPPGQGLWRNLLLMALLPAISEEFFFRGALLQLMRKSRLRWHGAIWVSAFVFSVVHLQAYGFVPRLLLGAMFGYMAYWSGSLWVPVLAHLVHNAIYVFLWYAQPEWADPTMDGYVLLVSGSLTTALLWLAWRYSPQVEKRSK